MTNYDQLFQSAMIEIEKSDSVECIDKVRIKFFGKNGLINQELRQLINLEKDKKIENGKILNNFKNKFFDILQKKNLKSKMNILVEKLIKNYLF